MMFPNSDFAYDTEKEKFFAVKDYSPSAALNPNYAERIEVASIAEEELYTAEILDGWKSIKVWTMLDTEEQYERIYSGCIVSDAYGQVNGETAWKSCITIARSRQTMRIGCLRRIWQRLK